MAINLQPLVEKYGTKGIAAANKAVGGDLSKLITPQTAKPQTQINVPSTVSSTVMDSTTTKQDVLNQRSSMESQLQVAASNTAALDSALSSIQKDPYSLDFAKQFLGTPTTPTSQLRDTYAAGMRSLLGEASQSLEDLRSYDSVERLTKLEKERGIPGLRDRVSTSLEAVAKLQGELIKVRPQIESEAGQTRIGAEARLNPVERNLRAEIASESLVANALQGNLDNAERNVRTILDLEFGDMEREVSTLMQQANIAQAQMATLEPKLKEEAEARANQFTIAIQERQRAIDDAKYNREGQLKILSQAASYGAPQQVIDAIRLARTPEEAIDAAGGWLRDPLMLLEMDYKRTQIAKTRAEAAQITSQTGTFVDPNTLNQYASLYATTGTLTNIPKEYHASIMTLARDMPQSNGEVIDKYTGVPTTKLAADARSDVARLVTIRNLLNEMETLDKERSKGLITGSGVLSGLPTLWGRVGWGDSREATNAYLQKRQLIIDEITRMQTGAALTADEQKTYGEYLVGRVDWFGGKDSQKQIQQFKSFADEKLKTIATTNNAAIVGYSPVKVGDKTYTVGDTVVFEDGSAYRVNADGSLTQLTQ